MTWDGKFEQLQWDENHTFFVIYQYGSCNYIYMQVIGLNNKNRLVVFPFRFLDGIEKDSILTDDRHHPSLNMGEKQFQTDYYDNIKGRAQQNTWTFDDSMQKFVEITN